ncbi:hypothetical protein [Kitasatospora sp. GP82]|uniref:hypothetical protein n=1 Tax=Kitasatospora sp. GP82 TaxID=3035089 RepID=UPI002474D8A1|nr:hypothetical protein [Kitasatospora sp. GP82]MDH6129352.1 hypothetical protein [Kitasatospora sp. GP82]
MDENTSVVPVRTVRGRARRRATALAGLMLAIGAVAACGPKGSTSASDTAVGTPASPSPTTAASSAAAPAPSASPTPAPSTSPSGPGIAVGEPAPVKLPALAYQAQDDQLTVWFYSGVCDKYGLKADESKQGEVDVRVVVTQTAPRGQECPALAKRNSVTAKLSQPLAGRKVVDIATGQTLSMDPPPIGGPQ